MSIRQRKYDKLCEEIKSRTGAGAVIIYVANGVNGCGYGMYPADDSMYNLTLPLTLRSIAGEIEKTLEEKDSEASESGDGEF